MLDPSLLTAIGAVGFLICVGSLTFLIARAHRAGPEFAMPCPQCGETIHWRAKLHDLPPCPSCGWQGKFLEPKEVYLE